MIRKLLNSFLPYLLLLICLLIVVIYLDAYAIKISEAPDIIDITHRTSDEDENIVQFETGDDLFSETETRVTYDPDFIEAVNLYQNKNYVDANSFFKKLEFKYPYDASLNNYLGLLALKEKMYSMAQNYFSQAIASDSSFFNAYINLAVVYSRTHQHGLAEETYRNATRINPLNPKSHYNLGLLYSSMNNWEKASEELQKSINLSSGVKKARSFCYYGIAVLSQSDTSTAIQSFNSAIEYKPKYQLPRIYLALLSSDMVTRENELTKVYRLNPNSYHANYYLGKLYVDENDPSKAEYHLRKALGINQNDEKIIEELSSFLVAQERYGEARLIISGFSVYDTLPQSYFYEARIAAKTGNIDEAITLYGLAQERSGGNYPEALLNQAILYKQSGENQKAIDSYKQAISIRENYAIAYYNLALLYSEIGITVKAIANYKLAIHYEPLSAKSWYNLASIYENQKEFQFAIEAYTNSIKANPTYLKALSSLGVLYAKLENYEKAIEIYKMLLKQYPNYARGNFNLGLAYSKSGQNEAAIAAYSRVIEIDPENIKAKTNIGVLYAHTKNIELAIKTFEDAVDMEVNNPELRFNLALQYEKLDRYSKAAYQYTRAIQLDEKYIKAYDKLIDLYKATGDSASAYVVRFKKLRLEPDGEKLYLFGKKLLEFNEYQYALESLRLALEYGTNKAWTIYWIGMAYISLNNFDEAISNFDHVTVLNPKHKFAFYRLGQSYERKGMPEKADTYYTRLLKLDPEFKIVHKKKRKTKNK